MQDAFMRSAIIKDDTPHSFKKNSGFCLKTSYFMNI